MNRAVAVLVLLIIGVSVIAQNTQEKPLILPMQDPPSPDTWLLGQVYGNTTGAYRFGDRWYSAGQGLHFGLDFSAPCGAPLVAVADGVVAFVDDMGFGSAPHNLILRHPDIGLTTLYGHLLDTPIVAPGQTVSQGDVVGYSGDPDDTCDSRPHLHFEVRSLDYRTAYNPVDYMDANWHSLMLIGSYSDTVFQQDLDHARRWMSIDDQPQVAFGGRILNNYAAANPRANTPPPNPRLLRDAVSITDSTRTTLEPVGSNQCCWATWWHPTLPDVFYANDGTDGQRAQIYQWSAAQGDITGTLGEEPNPFYAPDYSHALSPVDSGVNIRRLSDDTAWTVNTGGAIPAFNADSTLLMWQIQNGDDVPGGDEPTRQILVSNPLGENPQVVAEEVGIRARWLDATRLLFTIREDPNTALEVYDVATGERQRLGAWYRPRDIRPAPGGDTVAFYLSGQETTGVHLLDTRTGDLQRLDWFGAYRWRDASSLFYIPYVTESDVHQLLAYDIATDTSQSLTDPTQQPFTVMNGRWSVNADGSRIAFRNALDRNIWFLSLTDE